MYKQDLAFNNLQWLICHKAQLKQTKTPIGWGSYYFEEMQSSYYTGLADWVGFWLMFHMGQQRETVILLLIYIYIYIFHFLANSSI